MWDSSEVQELWLVITEHCRLFIFVCIAKLSNLLKF